MIDSISRVPRDAKGNVCATLAQVAFFGEVRAILLPLVRIGARLGSHRRGSPEQVACAYLVQTIRDVLRYVEIARAEGRPLRTEQPPGWCTPTLVMGQQPAKVIPFEPYLRKEGGRG